MIQVENITKRYGNVEAVTDVSFSVGQDQVLGFLGPNGAGKTTIMKILTGYHFPSSGTAVVDGFSVTGDPVEAKKRTGYLPEGVPLYGDMTVDEYLSFIAAARLVPPEKHRDALERSIAVCGLKNVRFRSIETLSKGYKQRVGLAQAIIHDPPILILDEPTSGLDPNQIIEIRSLIKELGKSKTVILSTHILQEVEAVCSRVLILNEGRIAAQGTVEEIAGTLKGGDTWELLLKGEEIEEKCKRLIPDPRPGIEQEGNLYRVHIILPGTEGPEGNLAEGERIFDWAVSEGVKILGMSRRRLSLEDIFVKLTGEDRQGSAEESSGSGTARKEVL
ncbi:MAG: ATP-binding cassette domain-containing protein [Spirochaetaceae bacterium]|jgi:ABC-2 type transport system ATP-binding protein|nr:ATP-binding cassette domain-containing protein [Spirochaetaceae bacterium]